MSHIKDLKSSGRFSLKPNSLPQLHVGTLHTPDTDFRETKLGIVSEFIQSDAEKLIKTFKNEFEKVYADIKIPQVLVAGAEGAGKR